MMRFLLDQGLPRSAASRLCEHGYDAIHVSARNASTASDSDLLLLGRAEERVIISLDADFHALLALEGATTPSVIRIRMEGLKGDTLAERVLAVLRVCQDELQAGAMVTVTATKIRVRRLPVA